ncbi:MAG: hypothetical protein WAQ05_25455, partial [Rubrivivax sp.]
MTTMHPHYDTIVCLDDLLRADFWPAKEFIYDLVRVPVFAASGINIAKGPRRGQRTNLLPGFDVDRFIQLCGERSNWALGYRGVPQAAAAYLGQHLPPRALVLSYEMPPWLQQVLDSHGCDWLDMRISPLRFGADLYLALRSNNPALNAAALQHGVAATEIAAEAALLAAKLRYRLRYEPVQGAMDNQCIYIGQTEHDASLLTDDGRFVRAADHAETLRRLAAAGPLHYKAHPFASDFAKAEMTALENITGRRVIPCDTDTYELLAREDKIMLVGLSSGVLQEAAWFGREAYALFRPICEPRFDAAPEGPGYIQVAAHRFMSQPLWSALLGSTGEQPPLLLPARPNHLRELHNTWWGYSTALLRHSEFQREATVLSGGTRQAETLRRVEAELAATRSELAALKEQVKAQTGRSAPAPAPAPAPTVLRTAAA